MQIDNNTILYIIIGIFIFYLLFNSNMFEHFTSGGSFQQLVSNKDNDQDSYIIAQQSDTVSYPNHTYPPITDCSYNSYCSNC